MEDINGFMAGVHGHDFSKGLLLILHTPGGMAIRLDKAFGGGADAWYRL